MANGIGYAYTIPMLIAKAAFALFEKRYDWRNPIRSVTIQAINLVPQDTPRQVDLFMNIEKIEKAERLDQCIETIRQRFGKNSIRNGILFQNLRMPSEKPEINHRDEKGCYFSINTPKTKAGEREIPMTEGVKQAFLMEREFQSQAEISSKSRVDGYDDFIFVNRYGDVQNQGNLNKALRRMMRDCNDEILEKYGADSDPVLLPQFSCHILRHTFATRLCESGANLKFIQSILGHADVSTTMNIYVDVTDALKKKEITAFDDYMTTKLET